jgi:prepilin-type N-terminal cleavage/methylation domain-containing protein
MRRIEQRSSPLTPPRSDRGFTFIEVLISLTILSLISLVVWGGLRNARTLIERISYRGSATAKVVQLDSFLRSSCLKVRPPFWLAALEVQSSEDRLSIPYYEGEPDRHLVLEVDGSYLTISGEPRAVGETGDAESPALPAGSGLGGTGTAGEPGAAGLPGAAGEAKAAGVPEAVALRFGPFEEIALATVARETEDGRFPWGVEVRLQTKAGIPLTLTCRLGGTPLAPGSPP